jgi:hypothetical protein
MDKKYLEDRLRELGIYSEYYHRLELKALAAMVPYDEKINCILTGVYQGTRKLLAVTDARILIVGAGPLVDTNIVVVSRGVVTDWKFTRKFILSSVTFTAQGKTYTISQTQGGREKLFNWAMQQPVKEYEE